MKIKAKSKDGIAKVKMLLKHKMETGRRKNKKTGKIIPAHHITEVVAHANGAEVFRAEIGPAISKNPYLAFSFKGEAGTKVQVKWMDNKGGSQSGEVIVK